MKKTLFLSGLLFVLLIGFSCSHSPRQLKTGIWRVTLITESKVEIPFNFEVKESDGKQWIEIITGDNRYKVDDVQVTADSVFIVMPLFDSQFEFAFSDDLLRGKFIRVNYTMPCVAEPHVNFRFFETAMKPAFNPAGRWLVQIGENTAVGEFAEKENVITGSFATPSGDYRFFEGLVTPDSTILLSCFDGGFVRLFTGKMTNDRTIVDAKMYSGYSSVQECSAVRDSNAQLPDAYAVTNLRKGYATLDFKYPNLHGQAVSLKDEKYRNKVVVVQFSGSWCPNCLDETQFLVDFYQQHREEMEVVCLAFERSTDYETAKKSVMRLVKLCHVPYEVLVTCVQPNPKKVEEAIPALENFGAFPTTVFIDKKGQVRKIHSGFSGPGTGVLYEEFVKEFTALIEELVAE